MERKSNDTRERIKITKTKRTDKTTWYENGTSKTQNGFYVTEPDSHNKFQQYAGHEKERENHI
jgi:hypothetical protein